MYLCCSKWIIYIIFLLLDNSEISLAIKKLEKKTDNNTKNIEVVFQYMDQLTDKKESIQSTIKPRKQIGYKLPKKQKNYTGSASICKR